jgi:hypothetical protein
MPVPIGISALDVVDGLSHHVMELVRDLTMGTEMTKYEFLVIFDDTFDAAYESFVEQLRAFSPEFAEWLETEFLYEVRNRQAELGEELDQLEWNERFAAAITTTFPSTDAAVITADNDLPDLSAAVRHRCEKTGMTPCDVLDELADDVAIAMGRRSRAAYLASKVQDITDRDGEATFGWG